MNIKGKEITWNLWADLDKDIKDSSECICYRWSTLIWAHQTKQLNHYHLPPLHDAVLSDCFLPEIDGITAMITKIYQDKNICSFIIGRQWGGKVRIEPQNRALQKMPLSLKPGNKRLI